MPQFIWWVFSGKCQLTRGKSSILQYFSGRQSGGKNLCELIPPSTIVRQGDSTWKCKNTRKQPNCLRFGEQGIFHWDCKRRPCGTSCGRRRVIMQIILINLITAIFMKFHQMNHTLSREISHKFRDSFFFQRNQTLRRIFTLFNWILTEFMNGLRVFS